ncbi:hypothetical protein, partial [Streptomyces chryseus]|uniref:hypothetical protein n=1 Tax=Streptomyces chryseus TaxID=68186 RepID=UPI001B86834D
DGAWSHGGAEGHQTADPWSRCAVMNQNPQMTNESSTGVTDEVGEASAFINCRVESISALCDNR